MSYCSIEELKQYAIRNDEELMRLTNSTGILDEELVLSLLEAASNMVDVYVNVTKQEDKFIRFATAKIATYYLFQRSNQECPPTVKEGFIETIQMLRDLRDKKIDNPQGNESSFTTNTRIYSRTINNESKLLNNLQHRGLL